jgi:hypothetical protein
MATFPGTETPEHRKYRYAARSDRTLIDRRGATRAMLTRIARPADAPLYTHFATGPCHHRRLWLDRDPPWRFPFGQVGAELPKHEARRLGGDLLPAHVHAPLGQSPSVGRWKRQLPGRIAIPAENSAGPTKGLERRAGAQAALPSTADGTLPPRVDTPGRALNAARNARPAGKAPWCCAAPDQAPPSA